MITFFSFFFPVLVSPKKTFFTDARFFLFFVPTSFFPATIEPRQNEPTQRAKKTLAQK